MADSTNKVKFSPVFKGEAFKVLEADLQTADSMRTHRSDKEAFFVVLSGTVMFILDGLSKKLEASQALVIPANTPHSFTALSNGKCQLSLDNDAKITFE